MDYDVVVVGAGPAGSTVAKCLAEKGIRVLLVDKVAFPREKPCGGGLPTRVMKRFPYITPLVDSISYGSSTYSSTLRYVLKIDRDTPLLTMVLRKDFDQKLVEYAVEKGASFVDGKPIVDVHLHQEHVQLVFENGETVNTSIVVGCDGIRSVVAEKTGLSKKNEPSCVCIVQEQPLPVKQIEKYFTKKRFVHLFIKTQDVAGYGWVFPKKNLINIGLGEFSSAVDSLKPKKNLKESYEQFIEMLKIKDVLPKDFPVENLKGGLLPIFPLQKTFTDRVLLCGDAAGFINPITGEGIYYAMASGVLAADVIEEAFNAHDTSQRFLSRYQKRWKKEFGKDLALLGRFNKQWGRDSERIVRLLTSDKALAKLTIGIAGGQISFSRFLPLLFLRYLYVSSKDMLRKK